MTPGLLREAAAPLLLLGAIAGAAVLVGDVWVAVARLADAQANALRHRSAYVKPGPLWWAFDPSSARRRGVREEDWPAAEQAGVEPLDDPRRYGDDPDRAVVLVDEIDKADPDVPNDLLVPLGSFTFAVDEAPDVVARAAPLVIITTNEERDLPRAFLRRCVILPLGEPAPDRLKKIARRHFPDVAESTLIDVMGEYAKARIARLARDEPPPSVAEMLDALAACRTLETNPAEGQWPGLAALLLDKQTAMPEES